MSDPVVGADQEVLITRIFEAPRERVFRAWTDPDEVAAWYSMSTLEGARRRGLGTALTARHVHDGAQRGCTTASLQSTTMAERVYAAVGFRDLGRILEYVP
jgi:uncharacterized protein YndB with AHSA1/START domain